MTRDSSTVRRCGRVLFSAAVAISCLAVVQACSSDIEQDGSIERTAEEAEPEALAGSEAAEDSAELGTLQEPLTSCTSAAQCAAGNACTVASCQAGQCLLTNRAAGTSCGSGRVCNGAGACITAAPACTNNAQCGAGGVCTTRACQSGQCVNRLAPAGTPCNTVGICSASGTCIVIR